MKISKPFNGFIPKDYPEGSITQWYGENVELYKKAIPGLTNGHNGIDIVAPWGTNLFAVEDGVVVEVKDNPDGYGKHIRFITDYPDKKVQHEWTYGHLSAIFVEVGDEVKAGTLLATLEPKTICKMGNTGFVVSSQNANGYWKFNPYLGTHLHLCLREFYYNKKGWSYYPDQRRMTILNYDNGCLGSVDFKDMLPDPLTDLKEIVDKQGFKESWQKIIFALKQLFLG